MRQGSRKTHFSITKHLRPQMTIFSTVIPILMYLSTCFFCIHVLFCIKCRCCQQRKSGVMQLCLVYDTISQTITSQNDFPQLDVALQLTFASAWNCGIRSCQNHRTMLHCNTWLQALNIVTMFCFLLILVLFDFCFTALRHILGHFGRGQLT